MKSAASVFAVGKVGLLIAGLRVDEIAADAFQKAGAMVFVKPQGVHERMGGVADLAQCDGRIFPPAAAPFGVPRTSD